jgi:hypothetical protein
MQHQPTTEKSQIEMNETVQNCEEEADDQITKEAEQRCVNDSNRNRVRDQISLKPSSHVPKPLTYNPN